MNNNINHKTTGGKGARIGLSLHAEIEKIQDERLRNGKSKERLQTEIITNLISKHKHFKEISKHIIEASQEEISEHGK